MKFEESLATVSWQGWKGLWVTQRGLEVFAWHDESNKYEPCLPYYGSTFECTLFHEHIIGTASHSIVCIQIGYWQPAAMLLEQCDEVIIWVTSWKKVFWVMWKGLRESFEGEVWKDLWMERFEKAYWRSMNAFSIRRLEGVFGLLYIHVGLKLFLDNEVWNCLCDEVKRIFR